MAQVKTKEIFIKEVYDLVKDEYTVIGKYKNNKKKEFWCFKSTL